MSLKTTIQRLKETKVLENYSYMTVLNIISALIGFFIYPYVVVKTGKEAFGVYPYALAIVMYFQLVIDFGFDIPACKAIVQHKDDQHAKEDILSCVFTAKSLLFLLCSLVFILTLHIIPTMQTYKQIFILTYLQTFVSLLFPTWYFQGMKNMRTVTIINLCCRLLTIPAILLWVTDANSVWIYALITTLSLLIGGLAAWMYIRIHDGLRIRFVKPNTLRYWFKDGTPFFMTTLADKLKDGIMTIVVGQMFGFAEVTLYDIAKKLVTIPRMFTQSINAALFPEVVDNAGSERVKKILQYERIIGVACSLLVIALAYPTIWILFGKDMIASFPLTAILCWTIYTWLVTGAYLNFVFIPKNRYYYITINQVVALVSCLLIAAIGLWLYKDILIVPLALTLSGVMEIVYCRFIVRKEHLL